MPRRVLFLGQIHYLFEILSCSHLKRFTCRSIFCRSYRVPHPSPSFLSLWEAWEFGHRSQDTDINFFYQCMPKAEWKAFLSVWCKKNFFLFISWDFESSRINSNSSLMTFWRDFSPRVLKRFCLILWLTLAPPAVKNVIALEISIWVSNQPSLGGWKYL